ncbi:c-type cytochrome [Tropicimonas isoalkanivorans]|uniref:Cytochrome c domain-containing protein n=1 Tax=Tropicimonas isoalkanivorans TaxID=441112 RepID=A0A1I1DCM9_9RHOB|nr:cytochrome c [Tropicimonas isoalkanivorans]SFB72116.1 hypothetical protein SAMN04488094_101112 [Tropicimonas isoalkanivorans]
MEPRILLLVFSLVLLPVKSVAEGTAVRLYAPVALIETGLMTHILPRFSLKTRVKVDLVEAPGQAEIVLGTDGRPVFEGAGQVWHMALGADPSANAKSLADWLTSDVGRRTVTAFTPEGGAPFTIPEMQEAEAAAPDVDGDAAVGKVVSREKCTRCHAVDVESRMAGIGSTPSFSVLRNLSDWQYRFSAFYAINPHPAFTIVDDVTPPFEISRPSPISPIRMTLQEVEAIVAYVAEMEAADLGAPLYQRHQ